MSTVARKSTSENSEVDRRTGRHGKARSAAEYSAVPTAGNPAADRSPVDLLEQAIERTRPLLVGVPLRAKFRTLWAAARKAHDLGASDVVAAAFTALAAEVGLTDKEAVAHVVLWALRGQNPWGSR